MNDINLSRQVSIERVMRAIASYGPISRASLAKELGLSKQTISEIMQVLEQYNWVQIKGQTEGHIGRRAITYQLNPNCAGVVVVDLGGTKIRTCIVNLVGEIIAEQTIPTDKQGGKVVIDQMSDMIHALCKQTDIADDQINLAVVGIPGVYDEKNDYVVMAPNIQKLGKIAFAKTLEQQTGLKIIVENDVNLAAKGEYWLGEQIDTQSYGSLVLLMIGTGLGAGIIVNGELQKGRNGMAGEIGSLPFLGQKQADISANGLESRLSGVAIAKQYLAQTGETKTASEIFTLAENNDDIAMNIVDDAADLLMQTIYSLDFIINPDKFVLGGSIGKSALLNKLLKAKLARQKWQAPMIETVKAGKYAAMMGGVAVGLEQTQYDLFAASYGEATPPKKFVAFKNANSEQLLHAIGQKT